MHENKIYHLNLSPNKLFLKDDKAKISGFGASANFERKLEPIKSGKITEEILYYPPEVVSGGELDLEKIDVYSWGMIFYQLIAKKSNIDLEADSKLISTNFDKFLENLKTLDIKESRQILKKELSI